MPVHTQRTHTPPTQPQSHNATLPTPAAPTQSHTPHPTHTPQPPYPRMRAPTQSHTSHTTKKFPTPAGTTSKPPSHTHITPLCGTTSSTPRNYALTHAAAQPHSHTSPHALPHACGTSLKPHLAHPPPYPQPAATSLKASPRSQTLPRSDTQPQSLTSLRHDPASDTSLRA
ncbi:hypothetical protein HNY73_000995 [Argiope bruennichi]|uniref:Uncharacterized protein n=1 Tax=Argiope bruennichi TaxID=94029 RepID=A0A8T0FZX4_ARGBR|nr:hypothetical protein HNY73_000995 [Argiope bruennichi]